MTREVELTIGYDDQLTTVKRVVPDDEPPPWDAKSSLRVVGKPVPRLEARDKVTGKAKYTRDLKLPGMLYGVIVRSPIRPRRSVQLILLGRKGCLACERCMYSTASKSVFRGTRSPP